MTKEEKTILIIAVFLLLAVGAYFYLKERKPQVLDKLKGGSKKTTKESENTQNSNANYSVSTEIKFPLKLGSGYRGRPQAEKEAVKKVQKNLNLIPLGSTLTVDGAFGKATQAKLFKILKTKQVTKEMYEKL